jgi:hypothetical protein
LPGYEASTWFGVGVPRNPSAEIIDKLNKEINSSLADPKMKARIAELGGVPMPMTPAEFGKREMGQGDPGGQHQGRVIDKRKFHNLPFRECTSTLLRCIIFSGRTAKVTSSLLRRKKDRQDLDL